MARLSECGLGASGRVRAMETAGTAGQRVLAMGLMPGNPFRVVAVAPMGDPITVETLGRRISLRRADAAGIEVDLATPPAP